MRNGWKKGRWLVLDEESGFEVYSDKVAYDEYGKLTIARSRDKLNPQDYLPGLKGPKPASYGRGPDRNFGYEGAQPVFVGNTSVPTPQGPLSHLFSVGVGAMTVEASSSAIFVVR